MDIFSFQFWALIFWIKLFCVKGTIKNYPVCACDLYEIKDRNQGKDLEESSQKGLQTYFFLSWRGLPHTPALSIY